jgi:hypothetical protein
MPSNLEPAQRLSIFLLEARELDNGRQMMCDIHLFKISTPFVMDLKQHFCVLGREKHD